MFDVNLKIIYELRSFLDLVCSDKKLTRIFSVSEHDFTRSRKLPFEKLVVLISKLCKKTLSFELDSFFGEFNLLNTCSVSAFCQQRMKLLPEFFDVWNKVLAESFYVYSAGNERRWKGYRLIAADGSNLSLVNNTALRDYFGGQGNQTGFFVQAKTFYYYDVLNDIIVLSDIKPYRYGETKMAFDALESTINDAVTIYDRNYGSYRTIALHLWQEKESKFIIRAKESNRWIKDFIATGNQSSMVTIYPSKKIIEKMNEQGFRVSSKTGLTVRLVRVELEKSTEVLITNLLEHEGHATSEFKDLYNLRWRIETNISVQKNILQLESFSGLSVEAVKQDFYATILITNLHSLIIKDAQITVEKTKSSKYPLLVNKNKSFGWFKLNIVKLLLADDRPYDILKKLHDFFIKNVIPIRKGRSFPRVRKNRSTNSKFKTFTNFKPAY